jgi:hypothetical protein
MSPSRDQVQSPASEVATRALSDLFPGDDMHKTKRALALAAGVALLSSLAAAPAAAAAPERSNLVVTPSPVTIDYDIATTQAVEVGLDANCFTAFGTGQKYGITAVSQDTLVATVNTSPAELQCGQTATFIITGVANGNTTIDFYPVAKNRGLQNKVGPGSVAVEVKNFPTNGGGGGGGGVGGDWPAAPAIANTVLLLADAPLTDACKAAFPTKSWRGEVIKRVADEMVKPQSVKETYEYDDWVAYVEGLVDGICGVSAA